MVSSKTSKSISLAISLLVVVISLTGTALAASAPSASYLARYTPGFGGAPGKMATDVAGNLYVADFWAKGIVKLDRQGSRIGFIPTASRPVAVAVMPDNRLVVAMSVPQAYVAFYAQTGSAPNITGVEMSQFGAPADAYCRPAGIAVDASSNIYVLDSGDTGAGTVNAPKVRKYSSAGAYLTAFGARTSTGGNPGTTGDLKLPLGIAYQKDGNQIYVADSGNGRLQVYSAADGTFVKTVGAATGRTSGSYVQTVGGAALFGEPADLAFDYTGNTLNRIYVADRSRDVVMVVDPVSGLDLKHINSAMDANAALKAPASVLLKSGTPGSVLYAGSAASSTANSVVAVSLDGGLTAPSISLAITSTVPQTATANPLALSGTVTPIAAVSCNVNGGSDTSVTPGSSSWSLDLPLVDGYNAIRCRATDGTTASYAEAFTYYTGTPVTNGPTPTITFPADGVYTNNATVVVSGTTDVADASIQVSNALNSAATSTTSGADKKWSVSIALAEGANVITVGASKTGTTTKTTSVTVNLDLTPPNMTGKISFLADGATTVTAVQNLDGIVVEKNLSSIVVNGNVVATKVGLPATDNTYFSVPVTLVRGSNTVVITATDRAGNSSTVSRSVTLNPEIPGLTVALPADNSYVPSAGTASASGTVDPAFASVTAGSASVTPAGGNWSTANMAVSGGFNSYQFTASGNGTVAVSEKRTINADSAYAQLAITNPPADLATSSSSVILSGTVAAGSPTPTISIDGAPAVSVSSYTPATGAFSHTVALTVEGEHVVKVSANASTSAIRNIIYDTTAPAVAVQATANTAPVAMTGTIEPSAKLVSVTARFNSVDTVLPLNRIAFDAYDQAAGAVVWHANLTGYPYDSLSIISQDPAGNQTQHVFVSGVPTGDVDGDGVVRLSDAMAVLRHVANTQALPGSPLDKASARFNGDVGSLIDSRAAQDGAVTIEDAVLILRKAYGLMTF